MVKKFLLFFTIIFFLFCITLHGQVDCQTEFYQPPNIINELAKIFSGYSPVTNFSLSYERNECNYLFESLAKDKDYYLACDNWKIHKKLEIVGSGMIAGLERNHGNYVLLGSDNFGLKESIKIYKTNAERTSLAGSHGLIISILDVPLKLPRQSFDIRLQSPADNKQQALWKWNDFSLDVDLSVPTPIGSMAFEFYSSFISSRIPADAVGKYNRLDDFMMENVWKNDWETWYNYSGYFDPIQMYNVWGLDIVSPSIGLSLGGLFEASLRLVLGAQINGTWYHADPHYDEFLTNKMDYQLYTYNKLNAGATANARIRAKIRVLWASVTKEWKIIEFSSEAQRELDGPLGLKVASFVVQLHKPLLEPEPCPTSAVPPDHQSWMADVLDNPAMENPEDGPTDLAEFANELNARIRERYFLCDANGNIFDPGTNVFIQNLIKRNEKEKIPEKELCKILIAYLDKNLYLCEKKCCRTCKLEGEIIGCEIIKDYQLKKQK